MTEKKLYRITQGGAELCATTWPPMAQTAWARATRSNSGEEAVLEIDGAVVARAYAQRGHAHGWPGGSDECDLRDVFKALLQLLRDDGWTTREIADAMTAYGIATTRARIDALRGSTYGKCAEVTPAEIVTMIYAVLNKYKTSPNLADQSPA